MGKYDNLPTIIVGVKTDIARKEQELSDLKASLAMLTSKLPKKAVKVEKATKVEVKAPKVTGATKVVINE